MLHLPEAVALGNPLETPSPLMLTLRWLPYLQRSHWFSQPLAWNSALALGCPCFT